MSLNASRYARHHAFEKRVGYVALTLDPIASPAPVVQPAPGIDAPLDLSGRRPVAWVAGAKQGSYFYDEANVVCKVPVSRGLTLSPKKVRVERWVLAGV